MIDDLDEYGLAGDRPRERELARPIAALPGLAAWIRDALMSAPPPETLSVAVLNGAVLELATAFPSPSIELSVILANRFFAAAQGHCDVVRVPTNYSVQASWNTAHVAQYLLACEPKR